jgi:TPR repeat protein
MLSNGADKDYRPGRDLYMGGHYPQAFVHLERAAKRGHMKSLYLIGDSYEHGKGRKLDRITAAKFYDKAGRKGYRKANLAYETLIAGFSAEEKEVYDARVGEITVNELL